MRAAPDRGVGGLVVARCLNVQQLPTAGRSADWALSAEGGQ
jgi:hypothetical protein